MKLRALFLLPLLFLAAPSVAAAASPVCSMQATPAGIVKGESFTLKWTSSNATAGVIAGVGNVNPTGSINLIPVQSARYVGTFTGPDGKTTCDAIVVVDNNGPTTVIDASGVVTGNVSAPDQVSAPGTISGPGTVAAPAQLQGQTTLAPAPVLPAATPIQLSNNSGTGIVPCTGVNCQACSLAKLAQNIINFLIGLSIPLAAALFAWAGTMYFSSSVIDKLEKAKKIFTSALIGFAIIIGAWLVVQTILSTILNKSYQGWNQIQCVQAADNSPGGRQYNGKISDLIGTLPSLNTNPIVSTGGSAYVCGQGTLSNGSCVDGNNQVIGTPTLANSSANLGLGCSQYGDGYAIAGGQCYSQDSSVPVGPALRPGALTDSQQDALQDACDNGDQDSCTKLEAALAVSDPLSSNTDCSPANIQAAAQNGGYVLTDAQAATLSCIAVPESACGRNTSVATTPSGQVTSATGMFQIVFGSGNDQCHNLNIPVCNDAAAAAGYTVDGNLNCYSHFRGGVPIDATGQACKAAGSNIACNASAAACLVQARGGRFTDWTSDSRSSAQQQCINKYAS